MATQLFKDFQLGKYKPEKLIAKENLIKKSNTVHYLVWQFLKQAEKLYTHKTFRGVKFHLEFLLLNTSGDLDISEVTIQTLNNIILNHKSVYQSRLSRSYMSIFFNWCINSGCYEKDNPIGRIRKPKIPQKLPTYITAEELEIILNGTVSLEPNLRDLIYDVVLFAFYSGLRLGEITSLTWSQVNFTNQTIQLDNQSHKTKSGKVRVIPLSSKIADMLEHRYQSRKSELVFHHEFSRKNINELISKNFKRIIKRIPELNQTLHFHSLRHSFASNLVQRNVNIVTISKLLGHSKIDTTMIYSHIDDKVLREAVNVL